MKNLGKQDCLVLTDLTKQEVDSYLEKFNKKWINVATNIICINVQELNYEQKYEYNKFFGININLYEFLIVLLDV